MNHRLFFSSLVAVATLSACGPQVSDPAVRPDPVDSTALDARDGEAWFVADVGVVT